MPEPDLLDRRLQPDTANFQRVTQARRLHSTIAFAAAMIAAPAVFFYTILFRAAVNIPFFDEYDAVLDFMNRWLQTPGFAAKASFFVTAQHNEYKLLFEQAVFLLQFQLLGHIDFKQLSWIGNSFVVLLALPLWRMFLPEEANLGRRLALFIPASWLLFQFNYYETLNWGIAALQNITVLAFTFTAIYLLFSPSRTGFCGSLACFGLAVASSGNGFLLIPIGLLALLLSRHYARLVVWMLASAVAIAAYSYRYDPMKSQSRNHLSLSATLLHMRPAYVIAFAGNAAGVPFMAASFVLGTLLFLFFAGMTFRGCIRRNPRVCCCILFLLTTAVGVAGIRSDLGLTQSLSSRYAINSDLLMILAWFLAAEEFVQRGQKPLMQSRVYVGAVATAVLFALFMDGIGTILIRKHEIRLVQGMSSFEYPPSPGSAAGPDLPLLDQDAKWSYFNPHARAILIKSMELNVYHPPAL
jgi:hypothetical protein